MIRTGIAAVLVLLALAGCEKKTSDERSSAAVQKTLNYADKLIDEKMRIEFLCRAHDDANTLRERWPESEFVIAFWKKNGARLEEIPAEVYALSLKTKNVDGFKWAIAEGVAVDFSFKALLRYWECGRGFRNYLATEHRELVLPTFMHCAVEERDVRFFNQHAEAFRASGYKVAPQVEKTSFYSHYCRLVAGEIKEAVEAKNLERLRFLIEFLPRLTNDIHIDPVTAKTMRALGQYVCNELKDEELACRLIGLRYDLGYVDWAETGFGDAFAKALAEDPEYAALTILELDKWHGSLSEQEGDFLDNLSDEQLKLLHRRHLDEAIEVFIRKGQAERALSAIALRRSLRPYTRYEFDELLGWAIKYNNMDLFEYVLDECEGMTIYNIDLVRLSSNFELFRKIAPTIFRNVYRTMDREPRTDGTTFGRVHDVLVSKNYKSSLWIISQTNWQKVWPDITEGRTMLMDVCHAGNLRAAKYLIEKKGADVRAKTGYIRPKISLFGRSVSKEGGLTPLFFAAASGNSELIRYLVSKGARVNMQSAYGATPLMHAVTNDHIDAVKTLLALRANVNTYMSPGLGTAALMELGSYDDVATAYRRAKKNGNEEMMELLRAAGARH